MNRKDREITGQEEIIEVLRRCDTLRLGLFGGEYPYIVPVSFGMDVQDGKVVLYFHCAKAGMKVDCIRQNAKVCVEADVFHRVEPLPNGITTRYESVIGFGTVSEVTGPEKVCALTRVLEHYGMQDHPAERCKGIERTSVFRIDLQSLTGKRNLPNP